MVGHLVKSYQINLYEIVGLTSKLIQAEVPKVISPWFGTTISRINRSMKIK